MFYPKGEYGFIEKNGQPEETWHMNIILNTANGTRTFGGPGAGSLIAATNIQVFLLLYSTDFFYVYTICFSTYHKHVHLSWPNNEEF